MILNINDIPIEGLELDFLMEPSQFEFTNLAAGEVELTSPVSVHLKVVKSRQNVLLSGQISCKVYLVCGRCLKRYQEDLNFSFPRRTFCPSLATEEERELDLKDMGVSFYKGEEIDTAPVVEEELILSLPFRPLCEEGCKGLCARCGADLNREPCRCAVEESDSGRIRLGNFLIKK